MPDLVRPPVFAAALAAVLVAALAVRAVHDRAAGEGPTTASSGAGSRAPAVRIQANGGRSLLVHVAGAVRRPGVYRLQDGARVQDAVRRAGGARQTGDPNAINLAVKVADGQQVVVPRRGSAGAAQPATAGGPAPPPAPVSLNSATAEQLDTLDGVGPATAAKIIAWRTQHGGFRSVDDLGQVPGIGPKRLAALRDRVQV